MKKFIQFRDESIKNDSLHPLIVASRIFSTFLHIHPFIDGNGRVGRSIMEYCLMRKGYPPIVFHHKPPGSLAICLFMAQAGNDPEYLYNMVLQNVHNTLIKYQ